VSREFFNQRASIWDETAAEKEQSKLRGLVKRLRLPKGAAVLDIGSGTGVLLPFLLEAIGPNGKVFALDFAEMMLSQARRKLGSENVSFLLAEVDDIPLLSRNCDAVVCYSSFPHFPDKPQALSEMHRVMRTGSRLHVCHTSSRKAINRRHRSIPSVRNDVIPTEKQMRRLLAQAGFCEISVEDSGDSYLASAMRSEF